MLRILHVVTNMDAGGLETMLMNYYRNIDKSKIQFDFLVHRMEPAKYDQEIKSLGGRIYRLHRLNPFSPRYYKELNTFFREHSEYKIIHVHQDCMSSVILKAAEYHGFPIRIAHSHSLSQPKNFKYPVKMIFKKKIGKYATDLMACSYPAGKWMFGTSNLTVLNNAIDTESFRFNQDNRQKVRNELGLGDELVFCCVARFRPEKNILFLLAIFLEILQDQPNSRLLLVGDGPDYSELKKFVELNKMNNSVMFLGYRADVSHVLAASDSFILCSFFEGLSLSLLEAQASGLPCLLSKNISEEGIILNDHIYQLDLAASKSDWANLAIKIAGQSRNYHRETCSSVIKNSGFDIKEEQAKLVQYYFSKLGDQQ